MCGLADLSIQQSNCGGLASISMMGLDKYAEVAKEAGIGSWISRAGKSISHIGAYKNLAHNAGNSSYLKQGLNMFARDAGVKDLAALGKREFVGGLGHRFSAAAKGWNARPGAFTRIKGAYSEFRNVGREMRAVRRSNKFSRFENTYKRETLAADANARGVGKNTTKGKSSSPNNTKSSTNTNTPNAPSANTNTPSTNTGASNTSTPKKTPDFLSQTGSAFKKLWDSGGSNNHLVRAGMAATGLYAANQTVRTFTQNK